MKKNNKKKERKIEKEIQILDRFAGNDIFA